jgi:hypothetical protein
LNPAIIADILQKGARGQKCPYIAFPLPCGKMKIYNSMKILIPKRNYEIDPAFGSLFFLAGPVRGGDDWQKKFYELLKTKLDQFYVAIPYYHVPGMQKFDLLDHAEEGSGDDFPRQLDWERFYLEKAATQGCVVFWLPEESKHDPRPKEEGAYATDTRGEMGRWSVHKKYHPEYKLVVGGEATFPGLSQIQRNLNADVGCDFPIYNTLEETVDAAIAAAKM